MSPIENVRRICQEKGIKVYKLEMDLGFSNGYLNPKKAKTISHARLLQIATYLGVSVDDLTGEKEEPAPEIGSGSISEKISRLSPELLGELDHFLALAEADPESAKRFLAFAAQELESRK